MTTQWQNFLQNLGEWHGSFATLAPDGSVLESTPSILSLVEGQEERLVHFRLRRFAAGDNTMGGEPVREMNQDYRSLGKQVVFFETGTFCKGSLQVAPATAFGAEFGFVHGDRRHRLVLLHGEDGRFQQLVLIREFRAGSQASERPPLTPDQLQGAWRGRQATISADWPEPEQEDCTFQVDAAVLAPLRFLPDGGYCHLREQVSHREAFAVEAGWLSESGRLERLIRRYDASGAWLSASHQILSRP